MIQQDPIETRIMQMSEREMEAREKGFCFADQQLCPISGWNAEMCGCREGTHEYVQRVEGEIKKLSTRLEDAEGVIIRYANTTNWTHSTSFTDLDDPEKKLWQDLWNIDFEDGYERAKTYCDAYGLEVSV